MRTGAPASVLGGFLAGVWRNPRIVQAQAASQAAFKTLTGDLQLSEDWFTAKSPFWFNLFQTHGLAARADLKILEIGSWEGLSAYFFLQSLPGCHITCVDTWEGADEHKWSDDADQRIEQSEVAFDANMSGFKGRVDKQKCTSLTYFERNQVRNKFDIVYVDGSHHCDDVVIDAIKAFEQVKVGGFIIFDDYLWRFYPRLRDNPASAINAMLQLKLGDYKVVGVYSQIIVQKTADRY